MLFEMEQWMGDGAYFVCFYFGFYVWIISCLICSLFETQCVL